MQEKTVVVTCDNCETSIVVRPEHGAVALLLQKRGWVFDSESGEDWCKACSEHVQQPSESMDTDFHSEARPA